MHFNSGRKQTAEHIAKRAAAMVATRKVNPWDGGRPRNTAEVLWSKVDKRGPDECWPWTGFKNEQGYGRTWINDKGYAAHRVIYDLANPGQITLEAPRSTSANGFIRHTCDNPSCCNPRHLLIGTHADNMADKVARSRQKRWGAGNGPNCKLSAEDVFWMRLHKRSGVTKKALALLYDVSEATVSGACYGRHYRNVA